MVRWEDSDRAGSFTIRRKYLVTTNLLVYSQPEKIGLDKTGAESTGQSLFVFACIRYLSDMSPASQEANRKPL